MQTNVHSLSRTGLKALLILGLLLIGVPVWGRTVGILKDDRSYINDGMLKTLSEAGWTTILLSGTDLADVAKVAGLDVVSPLYSGVAKRGSSDLGFQSSFLINNRGIWYINKIADKSFGAIKS